jgi:hypothetical protein
MKNTLLTLVFISFSLKASIIDNKKALLMALDDEYKAEATYAKVIEDFGAIKPFSNIIKSEQRHIQALEPFFTKYNLAMPDNKYLGNISGFDSLKEACLKGIEAEVDNVALYDKIYSITDDNELIAVFKNLQWASQNRHLRAFKRCAQR